MPLPRLQESPHAERKSNQNKRPILGGNEKKTSKKVVSFLKSYKCAEISEKGMSVGAFSPAQRGGDIKIH